MQSIAKEKLLLSGLCCLILVLVFGSPGYRHVITFLLLRRIFVTFPALQGLPHSLAWCGNFTEAQSQEGWMGPISPSKCVRKEKSEAVAFLYHGRKTIQKWNSYGHVTRFFSSYIFFLFPLCGLGLAGLWQGSHSHTNITPHLGDSRLPPSLEIFV